MRALERLIVALDYSNSEEALSLVDKLGDLVGFYKVGGELFASGGKRIVRSLKERGKRVFLDLKLFDIPTTVERTCIVLADFGVDIVDVHCLGGKEMMKAAVRGAATQGEVHQQTWRSDWAISGFEQSDSDQSSPGPRIKVIGVTMLTSFDEATSRNIFGEKKTGELSVLLAREGKEAGLHGVVCGASYVRTIKDACGDNFLTVVPGVRPKGETEDSRRPERADHVRTSTPAETLKMGADFIVMGRPITASRDPRGTVLEIRQSLTQP
ncbi:MAG: orotidine-5'-phosphate decarboxylase [Candidatus Eisenbacteria bacterium]|nr:orotidine-5'-phosphate decarboxylase [Candidatus Eisenbacteria bacterium]